MSAVTAGLFVGIGGNGGAAGNVCVNANGACNGPAAIAATTITTTGDRLQSGIDGGLAIFVDDVGGSCCGRPDADLPHSKPKWRNLVE